MSPFPKHQDTSVYRYLLLLIMGTLTLVTFIACQSSSNKAVHQIERVTLCCTETDNLDENATFYESDISAFSSISADGRFVAFDYFDNNVTTHDTNGVFDIFIFDRDHKSTSRISMNTNGIQSNGHSYHPFISADGNFVTFISRATNLVDNDTNNKEDIFVYDRLKKTIERVSINNDGTEGNDTSFSPSISSDGRFVAFCSLANNLIPNDTNNKADTFVYDRHTNSIERVSIHSDGNESNGHTYKSRISSNGQFVAMGSFARNLVNHDTNKRWDVFVYDRYNKIMERVSINNNGDETYAHIRDDFYGGYFDYEHAYSIAISGDGRFVAFDYLDSNLVDGDSNGVADIFVYDRQEHSIERISENHSGNSGFNESVYPSLSTDGRFIAFSSYQGKLVKNDTNVRSDIFVYDRLTTNIQRVSVDRYGVEAHRNSFAPAISGDGTAVSFSSWANNLVPHDTNIYGWDVFVHESQHHNDVLYTQNAYDYNDTITEMIERVPLSCSLKQNTFIRSQEELDQYLISQELNNTSYETTLNNAHIDFEKKNLYFHPLSFGAMPYIIVANEPQLISNEIVITISVNSDHAVYAAMDHFCFVYSVDKNISNITFVLPQ